MRHGVRFTANFDRNLQSIREYLADHHADDGFAVLVGRLLDDIVPSLESFPKIGRDFFAREPLSDEGRARLEALTTRAGAATETREYIAGDYLILYALRRSTVFLLAIRHHRQLSFDLTGHWP